MINNGKKDMMFGKPKKKKKLNLCTKFTTIEQKFLNKKRNRNYNLKNKSNKKNKRF